MNKIIGQLGRHTIYTQPEPDIQPGHQAIFVTPADFDGICLLRALTGATQERVILTHCPEGQAWKIPHDEMADQRLMDMVDLCASLRYSTFQLVQLSIKGLELDG